MRGRQQAHADGGMRNFTAPVFVERVVGRAGIATGPRCVDACDELCDSNEPTALRHVTGAVAGAGWRRRMHDDERVEQPTQSGLCGYQTMRIVYLIRLGTLQDKHRT